MPINSLRNAAMELSSTDLVFLLDVDLVPSKGLHTHLCNTVSRLGGFGDKNVLVVAAFELKSSVMQSATKQDIMGDNNSQSDLQAKETSEQATESSGLMLSGVPIISALLQQSSMNWPSKKWTFESLEDHIAELASEKIDRFLELVKNGSVVPFHSRNYTVGHGVTDFGRWTHATSLGSQCYTVQYTEGYEPFVVGSKRHLPQFDQRFSGYGYDKVELTYQSDVDSSSHNLLMLMHTPWMSTGLILFAPSPDEVRFYSCTECLCSGYPPSAIP